MSYLPVFASPCPACPLSPCSCLSLSPTCPATIVVCLNEAYMSYLLPVLVLPVPCPLAPVSLSLLPVRPQLWSVSMRRTCHISCQSLSCLSPVPLLLSLSLSYLSGHIVVCLNEVADKGPSPGQSSGTAQLKRHILFSYISVQRPNPKKNMVYGTLYVEVDYYNPTLCPLQSRLQHLPWVTLC
jgi:hypothetical protein